MSRNCEWWPDRGSFIAGQEFLGSSPFQNWYHSVVLSLLHTYAVRLFPAEQISRLSTVCAKCVKVCCSFPLSVIIVNVVVIIILCRHPTRHCPGVGFCLRCHFPSYPLFTDFPYLSGCWPIWQLESLPLNGGQSFSDVKNCLQPLQKYQLTVVKVCRLC